MERYWKRVHLSLADARSLPILSLFGLVSGIPVGAIIILFHILIVTVQGSLLFSGNSENYKSLTVGERFIFLISGSVIVVALFYFVSGHSVGPEGPCIHLGTAGASLMEQ